MKNERRCETEKAHQNISVQGILDRIELLYGIAYTIKKSKKGSRQIEGYFDHIVPPLEGFWWQDGVQDIDYGHKDDFKWIYTVLTKLLLSAKIFI